MQHRRVTGWQRLTGIVAIATLAVGIATPAAAAGARTTGAKRRDPSYVAQVAGTDVYVGVVVGDRSAIAYLCNGEDITSWFTAGVNRHSIVGGSPTGAALVATVKKGNLTGTILLPGRAPLEFSARRAHDGAGLFRKQRTVDGVRYAAGWVKLPDGSSRGQVTVANPLPRGTTTTTVPPTTSPPTSSPPRTTAPAPTAPPTTTPPTTQPGGTAVGSLAIGDIAPDAIKNLFPSDPPRDAKVATAPSTEGTDLGTSTTSPPPTTGAPTGFSPSDCKVIHDSVETARAQLKIYTKEGNTALASSTADVIITMVFNATTGGCPPGSI